MRKTESRGRRRGANPADYGMPEGPLLDTINEDRVLLRWAKQLLRDAEDDGATVDLSEDAWISGDANPWLSAKIRLVASIWPLSEWREWLTWQTWRGPEERGPYWYVDFSLPPQWLYGTMVLKDPGQFVFANLVLANRELPGGIVDPISFTMHTLRCRRLTKRDHVFLGRAVLDGLLYELGE